MSVLPILALAAGTFALRFAGTALRGRVTMPDHVRDLLATAALVLLVALAATAALAKGQSFGGWALAAGVAVGGLLAWRRVPFLVVVVAAAATTALLRLAGVG
ncbi:AzlD domain-containing protein [Actinokineospora sp. G85]|uniref:AzlD domain-containing protein n=1 Tax=Actinokineospora sp. G85 TaxID=3406626 RepID=UPI003C748D3A